MNTQVTEFTKSKKSLMAALVLGLTLPSLPSCTDSEFAHGIGGAIIGGIIGIIVGSDDHHHHHRRHYRPDYGRRHRYDRYSFVNATSDNVEIDFLKNVVETTSQEIAGVDPSAMASEFSISQASAERFLTAVAQSQEGKLEALIDLGVVREDLQQLAKLKMPSQVTVDQMASSLGEPSEVTGDMISRILNQVKAEKFETCMRAQNIHNSRPQMFCRQFQR